MFSMVAILNIHQIAYSDAQKVGKFQEDKEVGDCYSLDVIFLIDQSDSMSGKGSGRPNDPTEQRVYAPRWAIDWLADNALDICPNAVHRIAVISYGGSTGIDLKLEMALLAPRFRTLRPGRSGLRVGLRQRGTRCAPPSYPGLTPWATVYRPCGAPIEVAETEDVNKAIGNLKFQKRNKKKG